MKPPVVLRIYKGDKLEEVRQFEQTQIVIGRNADVHLELKDDEVAGLHAMIEDRGGDYFLSDLGSKSGTFRNQNKVLEEKIATGDEIKIGPYRIQFSAGAPKTAPVEPVVPSTPKPDPVVTPAPKPEAVMTPAPTLEPVAPPAPPPPVAKAVPPPVSQVVKADEGLKTPVTSTVPVFNHFANMPAANPKKGKSRQTFAPPAPYKDLKEVVKPGKGSTVEVLVAWKDRIISSRRFSGQSSVIIGNDENVDVVVPILSNHSKYELVRVGAVATIYLTAEMTGELTRDGASVPFAELNRQGKIRNTGSRLELELKQDEMVRVGLQNDTLSIYVRFVSEAPKPIVAPLLDMTASEVTGVILAMVISGIFALFMNIYAPANLLEDEAKTEEPIRKAEIKFYAPKPKQIVEVTETKVEKPVAKVVEKVRQTPNPSVEKAGSPGKAGDIAPNQFKEKKNKVVSNRPGGAFKTSPKEGANAKSEKPDPTKSGLFSAFGGKGVQKNLDKAMSGSGDLIGQADRATGYAGNAESREGDNLGTKIKDTGAGGKGTNTVGIAGLGTSGRGTGTTGYGTGGIGKKGSVEVEVGGQDAEVGGGIDKEAIRRVIRDHIREIRTCYERELQRNPDLYGKISIEWDIEDKGRVTRAVVKENALGNRAVADCIVSRLKTWTFPSPPADQVARVVYPFVFSTQ